MRDIYRIDEITDALNELWHEFPDMRLGQLIENFIIDPNRLFFQEDDDTLDNIVHALKKVRD